MDDALIQYVLGDLPAAERDAVRERIASNSADASAAARLQLVLEALRTGPGESVEPPTGLVTDTIGRVASALLAAGVRPGAVTTPAPRRPTPIRVPDRVRPRSGSPFFPSWRWADVTVAAGIGLLAVGITLAAIGRVRQENQTLACQKRLHDLHTALVSHADTDAGRFPLIGAQDTPTAGSFVVPLARTGHLPAGASCPAADPDDAATVSVPTGPDWGVTKVGYTYHLGYRPAGGDLVSLRRGEAGDQTPLCADMPTVAASPCTGPVSPHPRGQNVLYVGGHVRFSSTGRAGLNGDDIYRNDAGEVRAGLRAEDATLGRPNDVP
jgi:prepilin-type processing-associated H-X9-DG protein